MYSWLNFKRGGKPSIFCVTNHLLPLNRLVSGASLAGSYQIYNWILFQCWCHWNLTQTRFTHATPLPWPSLSHVFGGQVQNLSSFPKCCATNIIHCLHHSLGSICWTFSLSFDWSDGVTAFRHFLRSEFSEENLDFWLAVEWFKQTQSLSKMAVGAREIYDEFVCTRATRQVLLCLSALWLVWVSWRCNTANSAYRSIWIPGSGNQPIKACFLV